MGMYWRYLLIAGLCEIAWALGLKYSHGFTRLWPSVFTVVTMLASFGFLSVAVRGLPLGTAYAIWTGIGAAGVALWGIFFLHESRDLLRLACLAIVILGIVGLKLTARP